MTIIPDYSDFRTFSGINHFCMLAATVMISELLDITDIEAAGFSLSRESEGKIYIRIVKN